MAPVPILLSLGVLAINFRPGGPPLIGTGDLETIECGRTDAPSPDRALYRGRLSGPAGRTTPLGRSAVIYTATVKGRDGKRVRTLVCKSVLDGAVLVGRAELPVAASRLDLVGGHIDHSVNGVGVDRTQLSSECNRLLDAGGRYEEQYFQEGDKVVIAACVLGGKLGGGVCEPLEEPRFLAMAPLPELRQEVANGARAATFILVLWAAAWLVTGLLFFIRRDRSFVREHGKGVWG